MVYQGMTILTVIQFGIFKPLRRRFPDTDGDGMTDVYELKYGYDPNSADSFPSIDFVSES